MEKQKNNFWKIMAIIFIIISVLEFSVFILLMGWGSAMIDNENECAINICGGYDAYQYYEYEKICDCYDDGLVIKTKFIR